MLIDTNSEAFSDEGDSDDSDDGADDEDEAMDEDEDEPVPDPTPSRLTEEQRQARQEAMDKLVPGIDPSEYGRMPPSFHNNSQRTAPVTLETEVRDEPPSANGATGSSEGTRARPIRPPILPRDKYDGVDSDDETDEDEGDRGDEDDDENPQVVGEIEIDMAQEEEEFIEFARQALGVTDEQWNEILRDRSERGGAYLRVIKGMLLLTVCLKLAFVPTRGTSTNQNAPKPAGVSQSQQQSTQSPHSDPDTTLDSFEAVMRAMDEELARGRRKQNMDSTTSPSQLKGKGTAEAGGKQDMDIEAAMESELRASLGKGGLGDDEEDEEEKVDYQLIKNFLESFKSQAGMSGPVGNLVGRLQQGWTLPRDES